MRSFWSDPYLWIHLSGLAALPILLEICLLGLAVGDPVLPIGLELLLIAIVGVAPVLWMQWQRPFCIFSLLVLALKPGQLKPEQRKILRLFKTEENRVLAALVPIFLVWVLWQLYRLAPLAAEVTPLPPGARGLGLMVAAIAFLATNLFLQVPISVIPVLLTSEAKFAATEPYPLERIAKDFTLIGVPVKRILPELTMEPKQSANTSAVKAAPAGAQPANPIAATPPPVAAAAIAPLAPPSEPTVEPSTDAPAVLPPAANSAPEQSDEPSSELHPATIDPTSATTEPKSDD